MSILIPILIISILILLNGLFVAIEFAIVSAPKTKIQQLVKSGSSNAKSLMEIVSNQEKQNQAITTAQIGITIVSLALGMYGEHKIAEWLEPVFHNLHIFSDTLIHSISTILAVSILTYFHVVIGEMIPKSLALQTPIKTAFFLLKPLEFLKNIFSPGIWLLNSLNNFFIRFIEMFISADSRKSLSPEEIEFVVEESFSKGHLEESDHIFIDNILDLKGRIAEEAMTPRNQVVSLQASSTREEVLSVICASNKTRYPVIDGNLDQAIGILHIKDLSRHISNNPTNEIDLRVLARAPILIPESLPLNLVLNKFRNEQIQIAFIIDEFGGIAGILSIEDIIEEVVGEIQDEFDGMEQVPIVKLSQGRLRVRGDLLLDELEQLFNISIKSENAKTIGGFVMENLGKIPSSGDKVRQESIEILVETVVNRAVKSAIIRFP